MGGHDTPRRDRPLSRFKVYAEKAIPPHWQFHVTLFASGAALDRYAWKNYGVHATKFRALTMIYDWSNTEDMQRRCLGEIMLSVKHLDAEIIAHESAHAILGWWRKIHDSDGLIDLTGRCNFHVSDKEEWFVTRTGQLVAQVEKKIAKFRKVV
jgi:hypothetical protein